MVIKRGFNMVSKALGLCQGIFEEKMNERGKTIKVCSDCNACSLCVDLCPMKNLKIINGKLEHNNNCTICYRCVNKCPQKAITTFFHKKPKVQYLGV